MPDRLERLFREIGARQRRQATLARVRPALGGQMGAAGAAYAALMSDPAALRARAALFAKAPNSGLAPAAPGAAWLRSAPGAMGGGVLAPPTQGGLLPDTLSPQAEAYAAQLRAQQWHGERLGTLEGAVAWLRSLPDGYGLGRASAELAGPGSRASGLAPSFGGGREGFASKALGRLSASEAWRLADKGERAQNIAGALATLLGGYAEYTIWRTPGVSNIDALIAAGS